MPDGLTKTFALLACTRNEAAVATLLAALDSPHLSIQEESLRALLRRRHPAAQRQLLARWHTMPLRWKEIVREHPGRLTAALRDAVLGSDEPLGVNACDAIVFLREYDLAPALISAAENAGGAQGDRAAQTLLTLAGLLYAELAAPRDYARRRDPQLVRCQMLSCLERGVGRYPQHQRRELIDALLTLARHDNPLLRRILSDPLDACYRPVMEIFAASTRPGVLRLLLGFLDDPHAPTAAIKAILARTDEQFLRELFHRVGPELSAAVRTNLKKVNSIAWIRGDLAALDRLDGPAQQAAVRLAAAANVPRRDAMRLLQRVLLHGKPEGRRAVVAALGPYSGVEANELVLTALRDEDPHVQAAAVIQLREKGIPGGLFRLIELVESPHAAVRDAARQCLEEFSFPRFLAAFDMLDEEVRRSTGRLVRRIDPTALDQLRRELSAKARSRRLRAISMTLALDAAAELAPALIELLGDADHLVRAEAAAALGHCHAPAARQALRTMLLDRSVTVQEAAERSLQRLARRRPRAGDDPPPAMPHEPSATAAAEPRPKTTPPREDDLTHAWQENPS